MSQGQWVAKSGGKKGEVVKTGVRVTVPRFDNSALIASFSKMLIGRCMNPPKQDMKTLLFMLPRIWNVEGRVAGTDLGLGRFQFAFDVEEDIVEVLKMEPFHFDHWMISLVRWKPVLETNYPSKLVFWVRIMDLPLQFRAVETLQSVGDVIGKVQGPVDIIGGRVRVEVDGFKPLVFSVTVDFEEGVEITVKLRYEKLFGFCTECFCLTHEKAKCPTVVKEGDNKLPEDVQVEEGTGATSYKAIAATETRPHGDRREGQSGRYQAGRGADKGKGIARDNYGSYKQEGSYHPYKEKFSRNYGDGSISYGRIKGHGDRRMGGQNQGRQQQQHGPVVQTLEDPTKLMLDAFKGVEKPAVMEVLQIGEIEGSSSSSKARKALQFDETTTDSLHVVPEQDKVVEGNAVTTQASGELDEETRLLEEELNHAQALDEANLMIDGVLLSDSELMLEEEGEVEEWEHGEIMDFAVEEKLPGKDQEEDEQVKKVEVKGDSGKQIQEEGEEEMETNKEEAQPENGKAGATKKRGGQTFVSPRKKLLAKAAMGAKQGDKAKKVPKAKNLAA
ncbi:hypothetical protein Rs2_29369 [Raphanus sativus]|nr:hypothetical protein Rs2_29369 [Raphanus sativus]